MYIALKAPQILIKALFEPIISSLLGFIALWDRV